MSQTPVAWQQCKACKMYDESVHCSHCTPLFTLEQLNQARADALRDAAEGFGDSEVIAILLRIAAEIEGEDGAGYRC